MALLTIEAATERLGTGSQFIRRLDRHDDHGTPASATGPKQDA